MTKLDSSGQPAEFWPPTPGAPQPEQPLSQAPSAYPYQDYQDHPAHSAEQPTHRAFPAPRRRNRSVPWLIALLPVMLAIGAVSGYLFALNTKSLAMPEVESQVAQVLRDDYGLSDIAAVRCPVWVRVQQGQSFQCEFAYAGTAQTVTVTQGSQSGQLVVGAPE